MILGAMIKMRVLGIEELAVYFDYLPYFGAILLAWIVYRKKKAHFIFYIGIAILTFIVLKFWIGSH